MSGEEKEAVLNIESLGHAALVFVNKKLVGGYLMGCSVIVSAIFTLSSCSMIRSFHVEILKFFSRNLREVLKKYFSWYMDVNHLPS